MLLRQFLWVERCAVRINTLRPDLPLEYAEEVAEALWNAERDLEPTEAADMVVNTWP
jgi:hypothetical protein